MKLLLTLFLTLVSSRAFALRAEVRVAEKSTVRVGDPVRLGTLLSGKVEDSELLNRIYDLVVFEPMTSEEEKIIKSEELALTLRKKLSFLDLQLLSVKIPETFTLRAKRNFIYPSDLTRLISQQSLAICAGCTVELLELKLPEIKTSQEILKIRLDTQSIRQAGGFLLPLLVETSQGNLQFWVTGRLAFFRETPVTTRMIRMGERITSADFVVQKVNVTFAKDGAPAAADLVGKLAGRTFNIGQPIFYGDLKKEPAALRGQSVKILIGTDSLEITTSGTAEETGSLGDVIKVRSSGTQKLLSGVLIEKGMVRVE